MSTITQRIPNDLVISSQVVYQNGCFRCVRYWLRGWINLGIEAHYVYGLTGKETMIDREEIVPIGII